MCPVCESAERHRLYWRYYLRRTDLLEPGPQRRFLHFALEMGLQKNLRKLPCLRHVALDFVSPFVAIRADSCAQIVHCCRVLEQVADNRAAMAELYRVMEPGGWGLIQIPVWSDDPTFEDPSIIEPAERERVYGQHDHVRIYGPDVLDRLRAAGLHVTIIPASQFLTPDECERYAISPYEEIFHCHRPPDPARP